MIRINLLGLPKPKKGKRGGISGPAITMEGPSIMVVAAVALLIAAGVSYWMYNSANRTHEELATKMRQADTRLTTLKGVKAKWEEKDKQAKALQKRFDVIDQLRAAQKGPVDLLTTLADTVSNSDAVWLDSMVEDGNNVNLNGVALSNVALANYMTNLKKSGYFKNVELKETSQNDIKNIQAFSFTLTCERIAAAPKKA